MLNKYIVFVSNPTGHYCEIDGAKIHEEKGDLFYRFEIKAHSAKDAKELIEINELSHIHEHAYVRKVLACE